jgi:hypothetical protein
MKIDTSLFIRILLIGLAVLITDSILVFLIVDISHMAIGILVIITIGSTATATLVVLYLVLRRNESNYIPRNMVGYGKDGSTPAVRHKFSLIKEDELI